MIPSNIRLGQPLIFEHTEILLSSIEMETLFDEVGLQITNVSYIIFQKTKMWLYFPRFNQQLIRSMICPRRIIVFNLQESRVSWESY